MAATRAELWRDRFTVFGDCMLLGVLVAVTAIPVITAPVGFAAACAVVARWRDGDGPPLLRAFTDILRREPKRHLLAGIGFLAVTAILALDMMLAATALPGGVVLRWLVAGVSLGLFAVLVRAAAVVGTQGVGWLAAVRGSANGWIDRPGELLMLSGTLAAAGVLVWTLPPLAVVIGGPLALAATSLLGRRS